MRWSLGALAMPLAIVAATAAEERDCLDLPKAERPFCWMMLSCAAVDDAERRRECFDSVVVRYRERSTSNDPESSDGLSPADQAKPGAQSATGVQQPALVVQADSTQPADPAQYEGSAVPAPQRESDGKGERPWWRVLRRPWPARDKPAGKTETATVSSVGETTVARKVLNIPKRFTAAVTNVHALLHDRQLLVLDGKLLFETERAAYSRINTGDSVEVTRTSELFGERYSIVGTSGGAVRASRLRCESDDRGPETQRKCRMLARSTRTASD